MNSSHIARLGAIVGVVCSLSLNVAWGTDYFTPVSPKKLALVIGNSDYAVLQDIPSSSVDATAVGKELESLGFEVDLHTNVPDWKKFELQILPNFMQRVAEGDFVVFYYSGHGFSHGPHSLLAYTDQPLTLRSDKVAIEALSIEALEDLLVRAEPGVILMILDACRNIGSFVIEEPDGSRGIKKGLSLAQDYNTSANILTSFATRPGAFATGSAVEGALSVFTEALVSRLPETDKHFNRLFNAITSDVVEASNNDQVPGLHDYSMTDPFLNPPQAIMDLELESWKSVVETNDHRLVRDFLRLNAISPYAAAARQWLRNNPNEVRAPSFTRLSPAAVERAWETTPADENATIERLDAPIAFERMASAASGEALNALPASEIGVAGNASAAAGPRADFMSDAGLLAHRQIVVTEPVIARAEPSFEAAPIRLRARTRLTMSDITTNPLSDDATATDEDLVWIGSSLPDGSRAFIPISGETAPPVDLGKPLLEVKVAMRADGPPGLVDRGAIEAAIQALDRDGRSITWVSLAGSPAPDEEAAALRLAWLANAELVLRESGVASTRITIFEEQSDLSGAAVRVRFFGH